ncbi:MAG: SMP-30/gluconolactonase/LRE family protein [Clostridia bacterium]|nr:SMP-30/gluconolactonase/LRE family protein [Clostridia bacterium]
MKTKFRLLAMVMAMLLLVTSYSTALADDGYASTYTYNYDYWQDYRESPDAYRVSNVLYSGDLGLEVAMKRPQSLFVQGNMLYVVDTGNNRILEIERNGYDFELVRIIDEFKVGAAEQPAAEETVAAEEAAMTEETAVAEENTVVEETVAADLPTVTTFNTPNDVAVDKEGNIYVADTNNQRIVMMDKDLNYVMQFTKPADTTFDQSLSFLPNKLVIDNSGRVFTLATNVNKGVVKFEANGEFTGYVGANKVVYSLVDYVWKTFFMTEEQRAQQESFVPTEYCNIYMDEDSFIYATNISFDEYSLIWDEAQPIRRLNGVGTDILIKNDRYPPIGELYWQEQAKDYHGPSKFMDITVLHDDIYVGIDRTRGRLYGYDSQGIMLWAFGNMGNSDGCFSNAISIEHMGTDLFVLDQNEGAITVFVPTEYGNLIYDANRAYLSGDYDGSADLWREVLKMNANYNLAFIGIGRSLMRQENYTEAMDYFKMAMDRDNYGRAFRLWRKIWVEENIVWMVAVIAVIIIIPVVLRSIKKKKMEVEMYERNQVTK